VQNRMTFTVKALHVLNLLKVSTFDRELKKSNSKIWYHHISKKKIEHTFGVKESKKIESEKVFNFFFFSKSVKVELILTIGQSIGTICPSKVH